MTGDIVKWIADDPTILILNKTIRPKTSFVDQQIGEKLIGSGDWEAIVEYEELSSDALRRLRIFGQRDKLKADRSKGA